MGEPVPGAQVQQDDQQRQLVGGGAAAGIDHFQQPLRESRIGTARARLIPRHRRIMTRSPLSVAPSKKAEIRTDHNIRQAGDVPRWRRQARLAYDVV